MKKNNKEVEAIIAKQLEEIKAFIKPNPSIIYDLSKESGLSPEDIYQIINTDSMPISNIIRLHSAMQKMLDKKAKEIIARDKASREAKAIISKQLEEIKDFIKPNPSVIYELAEESGLSPKEIYEIIASNGVTTNGITRLHSTMQQIIEVRNQEIIARNIASREAEAIINRQLKEIKDFIKPNPSVIYELAEESGMSPKEIYEITYTDSIPLTGVARLYNAMQKILEAQAQEIIEKNKKK